MVVSLPRKSNDEAEGGSSFYSADENGQLLNSTRAKDGRVHHAGPTAFAG